MSAHGRSKALIPERAAREGTPVSAPGRPKRESLSAQREGSPVSAPGRPKPALSAVEGRESLARSDKVAQ